MHIDSESKDKTIHAQISRSFWRHSSQFKSRIKLSLIVAAFALLPIAIIGALGQFYASIFTTIPLELTNFQATLTMLSGAWHLRGAGNSWVPMLAALRVLHGFSGEEIYRTLSLAYGVPLGQPGAGQIPSIGESLYKTLFFSYGIRFQYPPTSLLPLDLLSVFRSPDRSELTGLNFAIYCVDAAACGWRAGSLLFRAPLEPEPSSVRRPDPTGMAALAVISAFLFYPLVRAVVLGQIQIWIDALFTCSLDLLDIPSSAFCRNFHWASMCNQTSTRPAIDLGFVVA